mgnify:CR=1 FL=1
MNTSRSIVEVGVAMVLKDRFSQEAGKISGSFRTMMNDMNTWNRGIQMSASNTMDFGMQLVGGMARAYKYSAGVQNEVWTASKIAGATIAEQREMLQLAKDVNEITPLTASDVASGQRYLAMAGNKFDAIKEMIGPASKLASIFTMPVGQKGGVADLMTNIMSMYQIPMGEAARVTDDLYTAVTNANISLTDLAQSISYAGADMATAGVDLRQTAAAIGVLGDMGIQGSMAGTSLANMIRYLQLSLVNQKKKGYNALADLGLSPDEFFDAQGNLIDLYTIYQKFAKAAVDLPSRIETPTFFNIFGVRGNRGMLPVLRDIASGRDKMGIALAKLAEEDPTFRTYTNQETGDTIISGMGELHLEIIVDRLLREFKVEANVGAPQVAYREAFGHDVDVDSKFKRQSGGSGQYGHCKVRFEVIPPDSDKPYEFVNEVVGGAIPKEYIPAVDAGIQEAMQAGVIGGFPVVGIRAVCYDGSYHEVDSSEIAFKIAGSMAFKDAMKKSAPQLLEPVMKVEITVPEEYMGDVMGDVSSRRGRIEGMEPQNGGVQLINAYVPLAEMFGYSTDLRSSTQGRGTYSMEVDHYEPVPKSIQEKIAAGKAE